MGEPAVLLVIKLLCYVNLSFFIAHRSLKEKQPSYVCVCVCVYIYIYMCHMREENVNYKCHLLSASVSFCALF